MDATYSDRTHRPSLSTMLTLAVVTAGGVALAGCESSNRDEPVGRSTTVEQKTVETPEGTTTVTEKREKETKIVK